MGQIVTSGTASSCPGQSPGAVGGVRPCPGQSQSGRSGPEPRHGAGHRAELSAKTIDCRRWACSPTSSAGRRRQQTAGYNLTNDLIHGRNVGGRFCGGRRGPRPEAAASLHSTSAWWSCIITGPGRGRTGAVWCLYSVLSRRPLTGDTGQAASVRQSVRRGRRCGGRRRLNKGQLGRPANMASWRGVCSALQGRAAGEEGPPPGPRRYLRVHADEPRRPPPQPTSAPIAPYCTMTGGLWPRLEAPPKWTPCNWSGRRRAVAEPALRSPHGAARHGSAVLGAGSAEEGQPPSAASRGRP